MLQCGKLTSFLHKEEEEEQEEQEQEEERKKERKKSNDHSYHLRRIGIRRKDK